MTLRLRPAHALVLASATSLLSLPGPAAAAPPQATEAPSFADVADLVLASPIIVDGTIRSSARIKGAEAVGASPGAERFYVTLDVSSLVRGPGAVPPRIGYLLDIRPDAQGRLPKLGKLRVLAFARPVSGAADQVQLVSPDAQLPWTAALDARVRDVAKQAVAADRPPAITGVGNAFYVAGSLPGEGETQVFLQTGDGRPVSLSVIRRPGEQPRWAVALSEIVDEAAGPPRRDTLLWYRLACSLPAALPDHSVAALSPDDAARAQADYRFVVEALGACGRTRTPEPVSAGAAPA